MAVLTNGICPATVLPTCRGARLPVIWLLLLDAVDRPVLVMAGVIHPVAATLWR